jgi:hypothetical protein
MIQTGSGSNALSKLANTCSLSRHQMYVSSRCNLFLEAEQPGYVKSDLAVSQRLSPWVSLTINVNNLGNSFGSESDYAANEGLGRTSNIGLSLRFPKR